jgi:hypothetical protein
MFYIIDNVLTPSLSDKIENDVHHQLYYKYNEKTSGHKNYKGHIFSDENTYDSGHFTCPIFYDNQNNLPFQWYFSTIQNIIFTSCDSLKLSLTDVKRVKINILKRENFPDHHYNIPHHDDVTGYSIVYYCNDSDGDTVLFNEYYNDSYPEKITEWQRVKPKKNRAIVFESNRVHASCNPKNTDARFVININIEANQNVV